MAKKRYELARALKKAMARIVSRNRIKSEILWSYVDLRIGVEWSHEQIVGWMEKNHLEWGSHEVIYQHIYKDKKAGGTSDRRLRSKKVRKERNGKFTGVAPNPIGSV